MKAPKILADIVESVAAAVYVDVNFDLQRFWVVCIKFFLSAEMVGVFFVFLLRTAYTSLVCIINGIG